MLMGHLLNWDFVVLFYFFSEQMFSLGGMLNTDQFNM